MEEFESLQVFVTVKTDDDWIVNRDADAWSALALTHTHARTHAHTRTYTRTHAYTHKYTRVRTQTHRGVGVEIDR